MATSTLIIIKPSAVARGLVEPIMTEIARKGYIVLVEKYYIPTLQNAEEHYEEHRGKPWFEKITKSLSSGKIYFAILGISGNNTVALMRKLIGSTDPKTAEASTIRARFGTSVDDNVIHASDSDQSAERECRLWLNASE
jgi:nucleoside-diphosphate kinase